MNNSSCHSWKFTSATLPSADAVEMPAASIPATKSSESPGRIGNSTPDSTNTTTSSPINAHVPK